MIRVRIEMDKEETIIVVAGFAAIGLGALFVIYKLMKQNQQSQVIVQQIPQQQAQPQTTPNGLEIFIPPDGAIA